MTRGRFIVFEGGEGTGKSTQAALLAQRLGATLTHEPGGTELGAHLREVLLSERTRRLDDRAEALLMAADRAQHVAALIRPALDLGRTVITDRYLGSSVAYQGFGRQLPPSEVEQLSLWATEGLLPDLVILLQVPGSVAERRTGGPRDRLEAAGTDFHRRVHEGFLRQAIEDPERWAVVDGTGTEDEVAEQIWQIVSMRFPDLA